MLSHVNSKNNPHMVDVSAKQITNRSALASGIISMNEEAFRACLDNSSKKGAVISTAITAGVMAAKQTSALIPMCHPLLLSKINIDIEPLSDKSGFLVTSLVKCSGQTGVEMEALTATSIALLTIYDMLKAVDKTMIISDIKLLEKKGGKSGKFRRD